MIETGICGLACGGKRMRQPSHGRWRFRPEGVRNGKRCVLEWTSGWDRSCWEGAVVFVGAAGSDRRVWCSARRAGSDRRFCCGSKSRQIAALRSTGRSWVKKRRVLSSWPLCFEAPERQRAQSTTGLFIAHSPTRIQHMNPNYWPGHDASCLPANPISRGQRIQSSRVTWMDIKQCVVSAPINKRGPQCCVHTLEVAIAD
jgi:hypothetical protein